jgi:regulator of PEP synthase PpsR (kinase-PPPase family)
MLTVFVVSDATGETAEQVVRSALIQFEGAPARIVRVGRVLTAERVREVVGEASREESLVVHTLVSDELRRVMLSEARRRGVDAMDLMGPLLERLATHLRLSPREKPGLFRQLAEAKSREIEAVEFAFRHDDGERVEDLDRAEVVLVGVSRTMKTPTMLYLAYRGWFAANVPVILRIPPHPRLLALPPSRVFCLTMEAGRLVELRQARAKAHRVPLEPYASVPHVQAELREAHELARRQRWEEIDVTGKSVEEVAREIMTLLHAAGSLRYDHPEAGEGGIRETDT